MDPATGVINLIDFEYAGYNPRDYDIANHMVEYMGAARQAGDVAPAARALPFTHRPGFDVDSSRAATAQEIRGFLRAYAPEATEAALEVRARRPIAQPRAPPPARRAQAMHRSVLAYMQLSHLFWSTWAMLQSQLSPIEFDYVAYAQRRMAQYWEHKYRLAQPVRPDDWPRIGDAPPLPEGYPGTQPAAASQAGATVQPEEQGAAQDSSRDEL